MQNFVDTDKKLTTELTYNSIDKIIKNYKKKESYESNVDNNLRMNISNKTLK